jgi:hypothetical protein
MDKERMSALLGRPLTSIEDTNFDLYLKIANQSLEQILCTSLCDQDDPKTYDVREGYSTVFIDIFTEIDEVKLDGEVIASDKYSVRQWDKRTGSWFNSIVFDRRMNDCDEEVEVSASWGFSSMPVDLQAVLAGLFSSISKKNNYDPTIASKRVEDFQISFSTDTDLDTEFSNKYSVTLSKYGMCDIPYVLHGKVC